MLGIPPYAGGPLVSAPGPAVSVVPEDRRAPADDKACQTAPVQKGGQKACQTGEGRQEGEAQTDVALSLTRSLLSNERQTNSNDELSLARFLLRVEHVVSEALQENDSAWSEEQELSRLRNDTAGPAVASLAHALDPFAAAVDNEGRNGAHEHTGLEVTGLSWNASGYVIAAAYGSHEERGWGSHSGALCTWNLGRKNMQANQPDRIIHTSNSLTCCAFHPTHPALIAGGTFLGEVYVWDLSRGSDEDPQRGASRAGLLSHTAPITQIVWRYDGVAATAHIESELGYRVLTLSTDGRLLVWDWTKLDAPIYGYELSYPRPDSELPISWGGTCMSFASEAEGACAVGTAAGMVLNCLLPSTSYTQAHEGPHKYPSAVRSRRALSSSPITSVSYSPHVRNALLSTALDGLATLSCQGEEVLALSPCEGESELFAVEWSPARPLVFAAAGGDGRLYFYDLQESTMHPCESVMVGTQQSARGVSLPVRYLAFNPHVRQYLATAAGSSIKVLELSPRLTEVRRGERRLLDRLIQDAIAS
eukprot:jgi/Chlat1/2006/Chrsp158S02291